MPTVPVSDIFVHRREKMLVVATFGRGVYILPLSEVRRRAPRPGGS
jgi:hypothetical protein